MKTLLIGINAKFIHSNLAIRYIKEYSREYFDLDFAIKEFTINQQTDFILSEIYKENADVIAFSCYIWNYELVKKLSVLLRKIAPNIKIIFGGPEVSYNPKVPIEQKYSDFVCYNEGEITFPSLIMALEQNLNLSQINGICYEENSQIITTENRNFVDMDTIPFVYDTISDLQNKIVYYETSRGCPFSCQYCLSSAHEPVRFSSLDKVFPQLDFFLNKQVRQVKFVDRTFNCNKSHAMGIWTYLIEHDNGVSNFHFEIAAELLDEDMLTLIRTARRGYFQFEIGVQSTNKDTLIAIKRNTKLALLNEIVREIKSYNNIHLHLDLIVGLPHEGYDSFKKSFNDVYAMYPDQFQVGFLKLLCGSGLYYNKDDYSILCSDYAPYEVLSTADLNYGEILKLKEIEHLIDSYYNSNRFMHALKYIEDFFPTAFSMYEAFAEFYERKNYNQMSHSFIGMYTIIFEFFCDFCDDDSAQKKIKWLLKADLYSHEKAKSLPQWLDVGFENEYKTKIYDFLDNPENVQKYLPQYTDLNTKQIYRQVHIEVFPFDFDGNNNYTAILYNYKDCDILGNAKQDKITL